MLLFQVGAFKETKRDAINRVSTIIIASLPL